MGVRETVGVTGVYVGVRVAVSVGNGVAVGRGVSDGRGVSEGVGVSDGVLEGIFIGSGVLMARAERNCST